MAVLLSAGSDVTCDGEGGYRDAAVGRIVEEGAYGRAERSSGGEHIVDDKYMLVFQAVWVADGE